MNFIEAKEKKKELDKRVDLASKTLNTKYKEKTIIGTVPDHTKRSDQYKKDLLEYNEAFNLLRSFNKYYTKEYKREINKENKARYRYG